MSEKIAGNSPPTEEMRRELGVFGAMMMGLGSILGTGVFVSIGVAAGIAGPSVVLAIVVAAVLATCNALNSAQLAASHPKSGGTYEYGYTYLTPALGFSAGWLFLCAKSASAATAALGFAGYMLHLLGADIARTEAFLLPLAVLVIIVLTLLVAGGVKRSNLANILIVSVTLGALCLFILAGLPSLLNPPDSYWRPFWGVESGGAVPGFLQATALMFVAYTGYGRIATMGEEVREPRKTIPRAIILTVIVSALFYILVGVVSIGVVGAPALGSLTESQAAPLEIVSRAFGLPGVPVLVALGAMTAMLGVLLNLILGLSRVLLAMGRRRDMPILFARRDRKNQSPVAAIIGVGVIILGLTLIGNIRITWSFSAFTVLLYYALTNLAALRIPKEDRLYPAFVAWAGLGMCLFLAFWVDWQIWLVGLGILGAGLVWHGIARRLAAANPTTEAPENAP